MILFIIEARNAHAVNAAFAILGVFLLLFLEVAVSSYAAVREEYLPGSLFNAVAALRQIPLDRSLGNRVTFIEQMKVGCTTVFVVVTTLFWLWGVTVGLELRSSTQTISHPCLAKVSLTTPVIGTLVVGILAILASLRRFVLGTFYMTIFSIRFTLLAFHPRQLALKRDNHEIAFAFFQFLWDFM